MEALKGTVSKKLVGVLILVVLIVLAVFAAGRFFFSQEERGPQVITVPTLEKIIQISELSTFTAVYNGIAEVTDEKNPEKIDYYVAYDAKVNAGIDFKEIDIKINEEEKIIQIEVPPVYITDVQVDIGSMDFIFYDNQKNESTVTQEAYKACNADVKEESGRQEAICELAKQNAVNVITALVQPIVAQADAEYQLQVV